MGGYLTEREILNKIENSINKKDLVVFHIDLSESTFENIIKEFFFKFLILKYYGYNDKIFCYNKNKIKIKIELPNSYIDYFNKYKILKFFKEEKKIEIKEKLPLLKQDNNYKIQFVAKVLKYFQKEKIKKKNININFNNINNNNEFDYNINTFLIENIRNLKNISNYYPNFYQKNIFINFLYSEFEKFMQCAHLNGEIVFSDKIIPDYFQNLRSDIIDSLIKNSIYFTFSPFDEIINKEFNTFSNFNINSLRENKYDEIIEKLQQEKINNIINYEKIEPSILAFHEKGIQFSIISTDKNDKKFKNIKKYIENVNLQAKYYSNKSKNKKKIYSYKNIEEHNYLEVIKIPEELEKEGKLLDELLRIFNHTKNDIKIIKGIIKKKFDRYVFTKDNFVKMFLLIMRIRAGIPTIIMGETGCGKTFLVKMFSLLYNIPQREYENEQNLSENDINLDYIYILKFHSGITDKDINNFIKRTIEKVNDKDEKECNKYINIFNKDYNKDVDLKDKEYENTFILMRIFKKFPEGYKKYNIKEVKQSIKNDIKSRKVIIFFDEINTCKCLGLVKNIICDQNYRKENNIPDRFVFIAACNPYRILKKENQQLQFGLPLKKKK